MRLMRACEALAAMAVAASIVIVMLVALSRYVLGITPVWTEPVVGLLIFFSICAALPPSLREGVHVSVHLLDKLEGRRAVFVRDLVILALCLALGAVMTVSAAYYAADVFSLDLRDYAGIPQGFQGVLACLFAVILALYAVVALVALVRGRPLP